MRPASDDYRKTQAYRVAYAIGYRFGYMEALKLCTPFWLEIRSRASRLARSN